MPKAGWSSRIWRLETWNERSNANSGEPNAPTKLLCLIAYISSSGWACVPSLFFCATHLLASHWLTFRIPERLALRETKTFLGQALSSPALRTRINEDSYLTFDRRADFHVSTPCLNPLKRDFETLPKPKSALSRGGPLQSELRASTEKLIQQSQLIKIQSI